MKLVEILARELKEWPEADFEQGAIESMSQADDLQVSHYSGVRQVWREDVNDWSGHDYVPCSRFKLTELATDHAAAIVTRPQWEAEKARIAGKETWLRHRGRKCPVQSGTLVDLRLRGGVIHRSKFCDNHAWIHTGKPFDVMYYRLSEPDEQLALVSESEVEVITATVGSVSGPLLWRDRITEIDRTVEALEEERVSLVQRLEGEGFALIERAVQPVEDMSDPANWRKGDLITFVEEVSDRCFTTGNQYTLSRVDGHGSVYVDNDNEGDKNGWAAEYFKWHSRPSK